MKKIYLFMLVGVIAIIVVVMCLVNFDPRVETWSSFIGGVIIALIIVKLPAITGYIRAKRRR